MVKIDIKRVYDPPVSTDGYRVLVDRLWPRGLSKDKAGIDHWAKEVAPSNTLRAWYAHDPAKWETFKRRYSSELDANATAVDDLLDHIPSGTVTFVYSSKERQLNNAVALKDYLSARRFASVMNNSA